jgi:hypothetical protein
VENNNKTNEKAFTARPQKSVIDNNLSASFGYQLNLPQPEVASDGLREFIIVIKRKISISNFSRSPSAATNIEFVIPLTHSHLLSRWFVCSRVEFFSSVFFEKSFLSFTMANNQRGGGIQRPNGATQSKICQFKLVLLGESAVGKSSLVLRFVKGQFHEYQESTIGAAFLTQTVHIDDTAVKFEIWVSLGGFSLDFCWFSGGLRTRLDKSDTIAWRQCTTAVPRLP